MHRNNSYLRHVIATKVVFGERGSCPVDQTPAQFFNIDPHTGRPMSDIQRLVHIQNDLALASEFAQLQEHKANYLPSDISDEEAIKFACPRLCQLPSELLAYRVKLMQEQNAKVEAAQALEREKKLAARQQELFDKFIDKETPKSV